MKDRTFRAKLKTGARFMQDFDFSCRWPQDADPMPADPHMVFDCRHVGAGRFDLRANGYGGKPYGNGSLYVYSINDLDVDLSVREAIIADMRAEKLAQIVEVEKKVSDLRAELSAIT